VIPVLAYAGRKVVVVGLGKSGRSAVAALRAGGAAISAWDDSADVRARAEKDGVAVISAPTDALDGVACVVWSPGVPHTRPSPHPLAVTARARGIPLVCDIDLLADAQPAATFVGVTGTNGKSTSTALVGHLLASGGLPVAVGGNLGTPALDLDPLGPFGTYVLELSSYQLELTPSLSCGTAILLNLTPDHIDRHGDMDGYIEAKKHIFDHPRFPGAAIIGADDPHSEAIASQLRAGGRHDVIPISAARPVPRGVYVEDGRLIDAIDGRPRTVADVKSLARLPGRHNWQNAAAATAAARVAGLSPAAIASGLATFKGLPHRQELVTTIKSVLFVNDSKATNADATEKALACYDAIYWIAGGRAKEGGIASLAPYFPRIRQAFLIGEAADSFADTLEGRVPFELYVDLETAIEEAGQAALAAGIPGAVVLLSPACASFDMFRSFEHRGDRFREEVLTLWPGAERPGPAGEARP
jgi:UDP-N-acetylmuramoylalanine--D-glutamate ligase